MLNPGEKNSLFARQKKKYSNSCVVEKKFWIKQKTITPPLQVKWSVPYW
jgi:hypothetical protein